MVAQPADDAVRDIKARSGNPTADCTALASCPASFRSTQTDLCIVARAHHDEMEDPEYIAAVKQSAHVNNVVPQILAIQAI